MKIKIYYIKTSLRNENQEKLDRYMDLTFGDNQPKPRRNEYRKIYEGEINLKNKSIQALLGEIYTKAQNGFTENEFAEERSMMVGDLIKIDGKLYIVQGIGFSKTEWESEN